MVQVIKYRYDETAHDRAGQVTTSSQLYRLSAKSSITFQSAKHKWPRDVALVRNAAIVSTYNPRSLLQFADARQHKVLLERCDHPQPTQGNVRRYFYEG
jgi:hypothetical protein